MTEERSTGRREDEEEDGVESEEQESAEDDAEEKANEENEWLKMIGRVLLKLSKASKHLNDNEENKVQDGESSTKAKVSPRVLRFLPKNPSRERGSSIVARAVEFEDPSLSMQEAAPSEDRCRPSLPGAISVAGIEASATYPDFGDDNTRQQSNADLEVATPVEELPQGQVEPQIAYHQDRDSIEHLRIRDNRVTRICAILALGLMTVAIILTITLQPEIAKQIRPRNVIPPSTSRGEKLLSLLPEHTKDAIKKLIIPEVKIPSSYDSHEGILRDSSNANTFISLLSPQAKAFYWTINDPYFEDHDPWRLVQRFALACLYYCTDGETSWNSSTNWLSYQTSVHETDWRSSYFLNEWIPWHKLYTYGIFQETTPELGHVWLVDNGLNGTVPREVFMLTSLRSIDLSINPLLSGNISSEIGNLQNLEIVKMSENGMSGVLPTELGSLSSLLGIYAEENNFHGDIPSELGLLEDLIVLGLAWSDFSGLIPSELGQLAPLGILLGGNQLEATIPSELGMTAVQLLELQSNLLTGSIPSEIGNLLQDPLLYKGRFHSLLEEKVSKEILDVGINSFLDIAKDALDVGFNGIVMSQNLLTGFIPSELGKFKVGEVIDLSENLLLGEVPSELGLLSNLSLLQLHGNLLSGSLPQELSQLAEKGSLLSLSINSTGITGSIPGGLCKLGRWNSSSLQGLSFDCSEILCGCSWCPCSANAIAARRGSA